MAVQSIAWPEVDILGRSIRYINHGMRLGCQRRHGGVAVWGLSFGARWLFAFAV